MKKTKILILFFVLFINIKSVYAVNNPYNPDFNGNTNCTYYAWQMAYEKAGVILPGWGNANTWYESAKNAGYEVGTTPRGHAIAIWTKCTGYCAIYGHVGYVESVSSDGQTLYIKDSSERGMNGCVDFEDSTYKECIANGVSEETDKICYASAPRITCPFNMASEGITHFIYLDNAPKTPLISNVTNNEPKPIEIKKSSNNDLSELTITNIDFPFQKEVQEYNFEVAYEVSDIIIDAKTLDSKATLEQIGNTNLNVGENIFIIKVTAEDKSVKEYKITITRKEQVVEKEEIKVDVPQEEVHKKSFIIIASIAFLILIIIILIYKKTKKLSIKR